MEHIKFLIIDRSSLMLSIIKKWCVQPIFVLFFVIYKNLLICVSQNDTANSSDRLMSNVWSMSDELMGGRKYNGSFIPFAYKSEGRGFVSQMFHWNFLFTYPMYNF